METITVGFSRPKKWAAFAWLIMALYGTPYDHVYIKFHSNSLNREIIYQASKMLINFMGVSVFESDNIVYREFKVDISSENKKSLMQFAVDNAGKPYSVKEALGLGVVQILSFFGKKIKNPFKSGTDSYVCSVIGAYILENYTNNDVPGDFQDASPKSLYEFLSSSIKD